MTSAVGGLIKPKAAVEVGIAGVITQDHATLLHRHLVGLGRLAGRLVEDEPLAATTDRNDPGTLRLPGSGSNHRR